LARSDTIDANLEAKRYMDLRQLRQFVVLAEELNFRRAAAKLHMTQPPLSAAIQRLEERLEVVLFERARNKVQLTAAGAAFLREARNLLAQADMAVEVARSAERGTSDVLRLAVVDSAAFELLPQVLGAFRQRFPAARIVVKTDTSENAVAALRKGALDVAIIVPSANESGGLVISELRQERFCVAVAKSHRLGGRKQVKLSEFAEDQFVSLYPSSSSPGYSAALLQAFHTSGIYPRINPGAGRTLANLVLVSIGDSVALTPRPMRRIQLENVTFLDVVSDAGQPLCYTLALARSATNASPLVGALWEIAREAAGPARASGRPTGRA
jgi:DNA-binding transcriptional LysR family regulator